MCKIFLSYHHEDVELARPFVKSLESEGYTVFWDTQIPAGRTWDRYIGEKLENADAVIVLWTEKSVKSRWVREEARVASEDYKLIPVMLEKIKLPLGFGLLQTIELLNWDGSKNESINTILKDIQLITNSKPKKTLEETEYPQSIDIETKPQSKESNDNSVSYQVTPKLEEANNKYKSFIYYSAIYAAVYNLIWIVFLVINPSVGLIAEDTELTLIFLFGLINLFILIYIRIRSVKIKPISINSEIIIVLLWLSLIIGPIFVGLVFLGR